MPDVLRVIVMVTWLGRASFAAAWALGHFWRTGRPAPTRTILAAAGAGGFYVFIWPRVQSFISPSWLFSALMLVTLVLVLAALLMPMVGKLHHQRWGR